MWRGNGMNIIKIAPESALKFAAYDVIKRLIRGGEDREMMLHERFVAGSLAGGTSQSIIYPLEVITDTLFYKNRYDIFILFFLLGAENTYGAQENWRG